MKNSKTPPHNKFDGVLLILAVALLYYTFTPTRGGLFIQRSIASNSTCDPQLENTLNAQVKESNKQNEELLELIATREKRLKNLNKKIDKAETANELNEKLALLEVQLEETEEEKDIAVAKAKKKRKRKSKEYKKKEKKLLKLAQRLKDLREYTIEDRDLFPSPTPWAPINTALMIKNPLAPESAADKAKLNNYLTTLKETSLKFRDPMRSPINSLYYYNSPDGSSMTKYLYNMFKPSVITEPFWNATYNRKKDIEFLNIPNQGIDLWDQPQDLNQMLPTINFGTGNPSLDNYYQLGL